ncbi:CopG family ribbon-helix-helix protein [Candidatus Altiarchaeota archaeon]
MSVISVSLPEQAVSELDDIVRDGGFKGRSDAIRNSISLLSKDLQESKSIDGNINGVLVLIHEERHEQAFSKARHEFEEVIKTSIHNQLGNGKCLELFLLDGEAENVANLLKVMRKCGRADYLRLIKT